MQKVLRLLFDQAVSDFKMGSEVRHSHQYSDASNWQVDKEATQANGGLMFVSMLHCYLSQ